MQMNSVKDRTTAVPPKWLVFLAAAGGCQLLFYGLCANGAISWHLPFAWGDEMDEGMIALGLVAAFVQWRLLRNEFLNVAKWLPIVFSILGMILSDLTMSVRSAAFLYLSYLSVPVYLGSAAVILLSVLHSLLDKIEDALR